MRWSLEALEKHLLIGSTLVEGSTLTEEEAAEVLAGRTISGHPVHELRELLNYRASVEALMRALQASPFFSIDLLLDFHRRMFAGFQTPAGRFKASRNFTFRSDGTKHAYLPPEQTPEATRLWIEDFNGAPRSSPEEGAANLYGTFQAIHPFDDGNGRIGRVLVAYWLHWKWKKAFSFYAHDKVEHLRAVEATNQGNFEPLTSFFHERLTDEGA